MRHFTDMPEYRHINVVVPGSRYKPNKPHIFMESGVWVVRLKFNTKGMINGLICAKLRRHFIKAKLHVIKLNGGLWLK